MIVVSLIIVAAYAAFVLYCAKRSAVSFEEELEKDLLAHKKDLQEFREKKEARYQEKMKFEEEAIKIFTLYEITREITKSLTEKEAFDIFKKQLAQHVRFKSCQLVKAGLEGEKEFQALKEQFVFILQEKKRLIGYLVLEGIAEEDKEKVMILGNQFVLALRRVALYEEIEQVAIMDSLTDVYTRRYVMERFQEEVKRSKARNIKLSFLMMDVDFFKAVNDTHGHLTGDQVLREIGNIIKDSIREIDIPGRYGGEEFCIVLPDTDYLGAQYVAERIRKSVEESAIKAYDTLVQTTVSIGVSNYPSDGQNINDLVDKADFALYRAKKYGRNKVFCFAEITDKK
ncbi:MAG: GGDEF domain-containing protein [Candidatus Omnitrophica bacterium]|nr:GGDEF domain-containing protein [Candidatus Omnitrophota bacterium]